MSEKIGQLSLWKKKVQIKIKGQTLPFVISLSRSSTSPVLKIPLGASCLASPPQWHILLAAKANSPSMAQASFLTDTPQAWTSMTLDKWHGSVTQPWPMRPEEICWGFWERFYLLIKRDMWQEKTAPVHHCHHICMRHLDLPQSPCEDHEERPADRLRMSTERWQHLGLWWHL